MGKMYVLGNRAGQVVARRWPPDQVIITVDYAPGTPGQLVQSLRLYDDELDKLVTWWQKTKQEESKQ